MNKKWYQICTSQRTRLLSLQRAMHFLLKDTRRALRAANAAIRSHPKSGPARAVRAMIKLECNAKETFEHAREAISTCMPCDFDSPVNMGSLAAVDHAIDQENVFHDDDDASESEDGESEHEHEDDVDDVDDMDETGDKDDNEVPEVVNGSLNDEDEKENMGHNEDTMARQSDNE